MQLSARVRGAAAHTRGRRGPAAVHGPQRPRVRSCVLVRAEQKDVEQQEQQPGPSVEEVVRDLAGKWDAVENKGSVAAYTAGTVALLWLSYVLTTAVEGLPVIPKLMELVGLGYTGWFVYRYLLFPGSREELAKDVDTIKSKITGGEF